MKIYELLDAPGKWARGDYALDAEGRFTEPSAANACAWCLAGALLKCYAAGPERENAWRRLADAVGRRTEKTVTQWNDGPASYEDVVALCRELDV